MVAERECKSSGRLKMVTDFDTPISCIAQNTDLFRGGGFLLLGDLSNERNTSTGQT